MKVSDLSAVQYVSVNHNLEYGINPDHKKNNIVSKCNNHSFENATFYNGELWNMRVDISGASYYLNGSITGDGKKILGSFKKEKWIDLEPVYSTDTFEMARQ